MSASKRLSTAVKALCVLARHENQPLSSAQIAAELQVNPSKLRQVLSMLVKSGLVQSHQGTAGGFVLNKTIDNIHMQDVYCAVEEKKAFRLDVHEHSDANGSTSRLNMYLLDLFDDVQGIIEEHMRGVRLTDVLKSVEKL